MNDNLILDAYKKFLVENIASKFNLERPPEEGEITDSVELVHPAVYVGWVPPKNYLNEYGYDIPGLIVMSDGGEDDEEAYVNIRIGIATYDPGLTDGTSTTPNTQGYKDTLNIISAIRTELFQKACIGEITTVIKPIKWGLYEEQNYPFWHGWISFQTSTHAVNYENNNLEKYL